MAGNTKAPSTLELYEKAMEAVRSVYSGSESEEDCARYLNKIVSNTSSLISTLSLGVSTGNSDNATERDMPLLIKQLVHSLHKNGINPKLQTRALEYLKRKGLQGSPLRGNARGGGEPK